MSVLVPCIPLVALIIVVIFLVYPSIIRIYNDQIFKKFFKNKKRPPFESIRPFIKNKKLQEEYVQKYENYFGFENILNNKNIELSDEYRKTLEWKMLMENLNK